MKTDSDFVNPSPAGSWKPEAGITKREYYAIKILQAILTSGANIHKDHSALAVKRADELILTLKQ